MRFPLPFTCLHEPYTAGEADAHGNTTPGWGEPAEVACVWWSPSSQEPSSPPTGGDRVAADVVIVVDSGLAVDHRDRFTVDGKPFEVVGLPKDYDHGPFGCSPQRRIVELKWVS
ncbi:MAG: hypothetical protein KDB47_06930 [Mycobacterium sp.]|nr:hypothetical protein [Mycobacterium sp.]